MIWNLDEDRKKNGTDSIAAFAFIHCLVCEEERTGKKLCEKLVSKDGNYDVKLSVNGIELDFADVCKAYDAQMDRMIRAKAEILIKERFAKLSHNLEIVEQQVTEKIREDLGLEKRDW